MEVIQIIISVFSMFALSRVLLNIKNRTLGKLESIFWTLFWVAAIFVTIFPIVIVELANLLGVDRGVDLIIYGTIVMLAYTQFRLYAQVTYLERNITKIIRTISIKKQNEKSKS
jgi:small membrane protein